MKAKHVKSIEAMGLSLERLKGKNVLITGATGLIASNLVEAFLFLNEDLKLAMNVYANCRNESRGRERFASFMDNKDFHMLVQDVIDPLKTDVIFDYIIHAASPAHPGAFNNVPVDVMKANFIGTLNLLEYARTHQHEDSSSEKPRFLFVSSSEVYGENFEGVDFYTEEMNGSINPDSFRSCYPESKRAAETMCMCYKKQFDSDVTIVRPAFIYGKEIVSDNVRADAYFMRQMLNHEDIVMYSKGEQERSYLYVNDCVSAILFVLLKGENGEVYNIGNDENVITLHDYAEKLAQHGGIKLIYEPKTEPEGVRFLKTTRMLLKCDKLKKLGWSVQYGLDDGIKDILENDERV
ncbi:MAG: NAD-dependent epimerase/dehydratase family protein [Lachnospiraceae bacterium]|nr:NAD-dependent epimerase/dehydratase family protein [Lachnospiraceae bacterium]